MVSPTHSPVRQSLARENDAVARESRLQAALQLTYAADFVTLRFAGNLGVNERAGVLQKCPLDGLYALAPFAVAQFPADVAQAAKFDHIAKCSPTPLYRFLSAAIYDNRVELVRRWAGLSIFAIVGDLP